MKLTALGGIGAGYSGAAKQLHTQQKENRITAIHENDAKIRQDQHEWMQGLSKRMKLRGEVENQASWDQRVRFQSGAGPVAQNPALQGADNAPRPALPQAGGYMPQLPGAAGQGYASTQPQPLQLPQLAEGGSVTTYPLPDEQAPQQAPAPQALPQQQPAPQAPAPQALPQQQPAAAQVAREQPTQQTTRRERYNDWYDETARYAVLTGGLEGYQKFQEMENATSRRQVLGYAQQAIRAMDQNNIGEAMRAGNTALEVTPFDTGLKFEAVNGKLVMVGPDGKAGEPLDANALRAFAEDHMKTPENYLQWKQQYETERKNLVDEGIAQGNLLVDQRQVAVNESQEERESRTHDREVQAREGMTLAALMNAKTTSERHKRALEEADKKGYTLGQINGVESSIDKWAVEELNAISPEVAEYYAEYPIAWSNLKSDTKYLQYANDPGAVSREDAAIISQMIRQPGGLDLSSMAVKAGIKSFKVDLKPDGRVVANKDGREVLLTPELIEEFYRNNPDEKAKHDALRGQAPPGVLETEAPPADAEALPADNIEEQVVTSKRRPPATLGDQREEAGMTRLGSNPEYFDPLKEALSTGPRPPEDENPYALMGGRGS
jgi:hypothetical protein